MPADLPEETGTTTRDTATASENAATTPSGAISPADRQALAELLARHVPDPVVVEAAVTELLAAGWRSPAPTLSTVEELDACRRGTVVTDRDGEPWIRNAVGEWFQAGGRIQSEELLTWAPLTRHTDGAVRPEPGSHHHD